LQVLALTLWDNHKEQVKPAAPFSSSAISADRTAGFETGEALLAQEVSDDLSRCVQ
jgi:hypothetical protein